MRCSPRRAQRKAQARRAAEMRCPADLSSGRSAQPPPSPCGGGVAGGCLPACRPSPTPTRRAI
eukprot:7479098-Alexandrium_andersonii.AAC.1